MVNIGVLALVNNWLVEFAKLKRKLLINWNKKNNITIYRRRKKESLQKSNNKIA